VLNIINKVLLIFGNPKQSLILGLVLGLIIGLLVGWFGIGWGVWPIEWTDAEPVDLSWDYGYQQKYLALLADRYAANPQMDLASYLGKAWDPKAAAKVVEDMAREDEWANRQPQLQMLAGGLNNLPPYQAPSGGISWLVVCPALLLVIALVVIGVVFVLPRLRGGEGGMGLQPPKTKVAVPSMGTAGQVVAPEVWIGEEEKPVSQYVTTYEIGDNRYDMSFSIESGPDFLGECGVAISENIGVGEPDKVTALEVWLFDKNDIRTVTKVLMSEHCFGDAALRAKLAPKGEAVLITPDGSFELDTQTLRLRARVVDMAYGSGGLPPNSFFDKVTLELAAWPKPA